MLTASVVSHGHGEMVSRLVAQLLLLPEVGRVVVTLNVAESLDLPESDRIVLKVNPKPQGFGANHNAAFAHADSPFFCVLNPDIELLANPFPKLLADLEHDRAGLCAPLILGADGHVEDSARRFMTPWRILLRKLGLASGAYRLVVGAKQPIYPEWVAGMFMLFNSETFQMLGGFDEAYFMYCEDADLCTRLWLKGDKVLLRPTVPVIHKAQRASRRSLRHLLWHLVSMVRYFGRYWGRLPQTPRPL